MSELQFSFISGLQPSVAASPAEKTNPFGDTFSSFQGSHTSEQAFLGHGTGKPQGSQVNREQADREMQMDLMEVIGWLWLLCLGCSGCGADTQLSILKQGPCRQCPSYDQLRQTKPPQNQNPPNQPTQTGFDYASPAHFFPWTMSRSILNTFFAELLRSAPHAATRTRATCQSQHCPTPTSILSNFFHYSAQLLTSIHFNWELRGIRTDSYLPHFLSQQIIAPRT